MDTRNGDHQAGVDVAPSVLPSTPSKCTVGSYVTELQTFKYRPLEPPTAIRIVVLGRGSGDDPIECCLLHTDRGKQPYETLSYEWGLRSNDDPIISIDGCHVRVRTNLRDALMQIRLEKKDRYMWIDALSIDQANTKERNYQVQMMGNIYKDAENVVVWLGPAKDDSDFVMDMFADPTRLKRSLKDFKAAQHAAILALFHRSYWRRVWIQQEMYLAQRFMVHCGSKCFSDANLDEALNSLAGKAYQEEIAKGAMHLVMKRKNFEKILGPHTNTLYSWLNECIIMRLESSEPRDLIYAMLGISYDCQNGELLPDYKKPLLEVYLETVAFCNRSTNSTFPRRLAEKLGLTFDENLKCLISEFNTAA